MDKLVLTQMIKAEALRLGFSACGMAPAGYVREDALYLKQWLSTGMNAEMNYMGNYYEKRCDPRLLMEGAKSVVSVALNYYPEKILTKEQYQFAWYAYGKDYHEAMKKRLRLLLEFINRLIPINGRFFCDTAPILERYWAWRAGLGWIGKNTQLIIPFSGSCFILGELFLDIELSYDTPRRERCGNCTRCLDHCPGGALEKPYTLNSCKCISYLTIENREEIFSEKVTMPGNRIYGCDECQKVCPWNRFAIPTGVEEFKPSSEFMEATPHFWQSLTLEQYQAMFKGSAVKRAKYEGLKRNIRLVELKEGQPELEFSIKPANLKQE